MTKQVNRKNSVSGAEICIAAVVLLPFAVKILCGVLGLYNTMTGKNGLKNIIAAVCLSSFSALFISLSVFIFGVMSIRGIIKHRDEMKNLFLSIFGIGFLTITVPLLLFFGFNRSCYSEQQHITDKSGIFGDIRILSDCISDYFSDEYDEYTVNDLWFDYSSHLSMTGRGGSSFHNEYVMSGYYDNEFIGSGQLFKAQIGKDDYNFFRESLPKGFDTTVTVYKKSGFIRSVEPSMDFGRKESYFHIYEIFICGDRIFRSEKNSAVEIDNLQWCGFKSGESGDITNALFGINADKGNEYPHDLTGFDEICLYAWADGGYKRVSNIIYKEDIK